MEDLFRLLNIRFKKQWKPYNSLFAELQVGNLKLIEGYSPLSVEGIFMGWHRHVLDMKKRNSDLNHNSLVLLEANC